MPEQKNEHFEYPPWLGWTLLAVVIIGVLDALSGSNLKEMALVQILHLGG